MDSLGLLLERQVPTLAVGFLCILLQRLSPSIPRQKAWTKESGLNLQYLLASTFVFPIFYVAFIYFMFAGARRYVGYDAAAVSSVSEQPIVLQILLALIVTDVVSYWMHRLFHGSALWRIHAVHHSSTEIDWLSAVRVHPVEQLISVLPQLFVASVVVGFSDEVVGIVGVIRSGYFLLTHANVNWTYGWFGYAMASPVFHRWHHTQESQALNKNFGGVFTFWDHLFGTAYRSGDDQPRVFGTDEVVGLGFFAQLGSPFLSRAKRLGRMPQG